MPPGIHNLPLLDLALDQHRRRDLPAAETSCRQILQQQPDCSEAWHLLGLIAHQQGRPVDACQQIARALALRPNDPNCLNNLGLALRACGKPCEAEKCFTHAIELNPEYAEALTNLSFLLSQMGRRDAAVEPAKRAIQINPDLAAAHAALGESLSEIDLKGSLEAFKRSLFLDPDQPDALNNVGAVLTQMGHYWDAEAAFKQAIEITPRFPAAWNNLGIVHMRMNQQDRAMIAFNQAILLDPNYVPAHVDRATALLLKGDFLNGWREYEWRWKAPSLPKDRRVLHKPLPPITPDLKLDGKRILIYAEQGFGDIIHFIRYAPLLARAGATVMVAMVPPQLASLVQSVEGVARVEKKSDERADPEPTSPVVSPLNDAEYDFDANIMSLPMLFGTVLQTIPAQVPYLGPPAEKVRAWRDRLPRDGKLKVGLRWAGNPKHSNDLNRSLDPNFLVPLLANERVAFYSLQVDRDRLASPNLVDWTAELQDFSDTAALIANLDLVISVDTAVAHLAGAMAKPVWVMLPFGPEFRWLLNRTDSPWYPTMHLFRQPHQGDWQAVVHEIDAQLRL